MRRIFASVLLASALLILAAPVTLAQSGSSIAGVVKDSSGAVLPGVTVQETITVSGETPTVDVQNVTQQRVMTRDIMSAVPAGMRSAAQLAVLIPDVTTNNQDVGGTAFSASAIAIHGSRLQEQTQLYDGMNASSILAITNTYGSLWLRPTQILQGRLLKFGGQIDF